MTFGITGADNRDQLDVRTLQDVRVTKLGRLIAEIDNFQKSVLWNSLQLQDGVPPRKEPIRFFIAPGRDLFCQILISLMLTTKERASPATSLPTDRPAPGIAAGRRELHGEEVGGARRPPIATREELAPAEIGDGPLPSTAAGVINVPGTTVPGLASTTTMTELLPTATAAAVAMATTRGITVTVETPAAVVVPGEGSTRRRHNDA